MGVYNRLHTEITCVKCLQKFEGVLQFKAGYTWLHDYHVGDVVREDDRADLELKDRCAMVYGILEEGHCPHCKYVFKDHEDEFDITMEHMKIISVKPMEDYAPYADAEPREGRYYFI